MMFLVLVFGLAVPIMGLGMMAEAADGNSSLRDGIAGAVVTLSSLAIAYLAW